MPRSRQRFAPNQDYLLALQVSSDQPFRAPNGCLMAGWEKVASTLNSCSAFKTHALKGPIAKNRFERLVGRHRSWMENGSKAEDAPSEDAAFMSVMMGLVPELDAAAAEPVAQTLGKRGRPRKVRPAEALAAPAMKKRSPAPSQVAIAPSRVASQVPSSSSTSLLVDSEDQALPGVAKATRQRFTRRDDVLLAKYVKQSLPFRAKFGAISAAWDDVAMKLDSNPEFSKQSIKGPVVRYRFENLVAKYRLRVQRNDGRVVGSKGTPAGELEVLMTELVTLLDGGDPVSAAVLAQNVAIVTGSVNAMKERKPFCASKSQDYDSTSTNTEPSSPGSTVSEVLPAVHQRCIALPPDSQSMNTRTSAKSVTTPDAVVNTLSPFNIAEFEKLLQKMFEQQNRTIKQMVLPQREERHLEAERLAQELKLEREERKKEREEREKERAKEQEEREKEREDRKKEREEREKEREEREKESEERKKEREMVRALREEREKERENEPELHEKEREKDRQVLTSAVISAMKTLLEQSDCKKAEGNDVVPTRAL